MFARNFGMFAGPAERHYAKAASEQMLEQYWKLRRESPDMDVRGVYESVVAERLGNERSRAAELVKRAEDSFTQWPVERELRFRDVVHYLIFDEYMRQGKAREGTKTNMGGVVARIIPEEL